MTSEQMEIWHNPRCSKSRAAKAALDEAGIAYTERRYLDNPPSVAELRTILERLGLEPWDITRTAEDEAKELGVADWPRTPAERDRWIEALAAHPKLIQRPIVATAAGRAVLARDEQTLRSVLPPA
ncbi:arsenate reductase family protein [Nocardia sp. NPDC003482]